MQSAGDAETTLDLPKPGALRIAPSAAEWTGQQGRPSAQEVFFDDIQACWMAFLHEGQVLLDQPGCDKAMVSKCTKCQL